MKPEPHQPTQSIPTTVHHVGPLTTRPCLGWSRAGLCWRAWVVVRCSTSVRCGPGIDSIVDSHIRRAQSVAVPWHGGRLGRPCGENPRLSGLQRIDVDHRSLSTPRHDVSEPSPGPTQAWSGRDWSGEIHCTVVRILCIEQWGFGFIEALGDGVQLELDHAQKLGGRDDDDDDDEPRPRWG